MNERLPSSRIQPEPRRFAFGDVILLKEESEWPEFIEWANIYLDKRLGLPTSFEEARKLGRAAKFLFSLHSFPGWDELVHEQYKTLPDLVEKPFDYPVIGTSLAYLSARRGLPATVAVHDELYSMRYLPGFDNIMRDFTTREDLLAMKLDLFQRRTGIKVDPKDFPKPDLRPIGILKEEGDISKDAKLWRDRYFDSLNKLSELNNQLTLINKGIDLGVDIIRKSQNS